MKKSYKAYSNRSYLAKEDFPKPEILTIEEVCEERVKANGKPEQSKLIIYFEGLEKGLVNNLTNGAALEAMIKAANPDIEDPENPQRWPGLRVEVFVDPSVMYQGKREGGIRLRPAPAQDDMPY